MKYERKIRVKRDSGFTLIEVLISLLLVSLALVSITNIIGFALDGYRKSVIRFRMVEEIENCKNRLIAKSFDSIDLSAGSYGKKEGEIKITWNIKDLSPTLKRFSLSSSYKVYNRRIYFYKSKFITNQGEEK